jgi:hypothetical protein
MSHKELRSQGITEEYLEEVLHRCNRASKGPWKAYIEGRDHTSGSSFIRTGAPRDLEIIGASEADYEFIACAKQDVELLAAEVKRLTHLLNSSKPQ